MKQKMYLLCLLVMVTTAAFSQQKSNSNVMSKESANVACKLTTPELQERKRTVLAEVKGLVIERKETEKGVRYKFDGSDKTIDLLTSFIKTERLCCGFFDFDLSVGGEDSFVWLELSGPEGTKDFIEAEIGF